MTNFDDVSKSEIINRILLEVEKHGSSRVGFHCEEVLGKDRPIPYNIKSKIEATIVSSRKYISRSHPNFKNDFEILLNSAYEEERDNLEMQQLRSNNQLLVEQLADYPKIKKERNLAIIIAILSLLANIILGIFTANKS